MASVAKRKWTHKGVQKEAWECRYFDQGGSRRSKTFDLKKDADAFKRKVEREIEDGTHVAASASKTVGDVITDYLTEVHTRERDGRIGTGHAKRQHMVCRLYLQPAIGRKLIRDLTMEDVSSLYQGMVGKGLHARSAKQYLHVLHALELFARKRGWLKTQPVADGLSELRGIPAFKVETFKPDEVTRLLVSAPANMKGRPLRTASFMGCAVALASLCGLRAGEILGLQIESVDLQRRVLMIRHNLTTYRELKGPKTAAGNRDVPIPEPVANLLTHWTEKHFRENDGGYFFSTSGGRPFCYFALHESWKRLLKREDMPRRHFHALRHFYASWLLRHGMPVADVSKMIGHSSHQMTLQVYTHALMEGDEAVRHVDRIAGLLPAAAATVTQQHVTA